MLLDQVRTTTWPKRHWPIFQRLAELAAAMPADPTLVLIGPGGVARPVRPFIHDAVWEKTPWLRRSVRNFPRFIDQALRRIPFIPLVSLEPGELRSLIQRPFRLVVVDISQRVLDGIQRDYAGVECHRIDIAVKTIPVQADVIVAYSVLTRTSDGAGSMAHVIEALKPGGLLLLDDRSAQRWLPKPPAFTVVSEDVRRAI